MNCFDWQNRASEYLDGTLIANQKRDADEHLEGCEPCSTRYKHYRLILTSISSQPRNSLPVAIRKAPLSSPISRKRRIPLAERLTQWSNAPWYLRVPVEGAGIVILITLAISAGPRLRNFYEQKVERSLTEYSEGFSGGDSETEPTAQLARGTVANTGTNPGAVAANGADEYSSSEGDSGDSADAEDGTDEEPQVVKAGRSDTWRFNLKTDSPHEVRAKIVEILQGLKIPSTTPGVGGIEAPGGIQFDLVVPAGIIPELKQALEKIAPAPPKEQEDSPLGETFTWYKKRSKTPVAAGQTHVVIWLAQI